MTFLYPLGLVGLVGIPVLILIYIIKNRYTEQIISSTYIWTLSEKFLKRKVPISKIAHLISLLLQILVVVCVAFAIAHPIWVVHDSASSYCFVIDASGSMNFVQNGQTRFDIAKDKICQIIDESKNGSDYTLVYSGDTTDFIFEAVTNKDTAKEYVGRLSVGYVPMDSADALKAAQDYFNYNTSVLTYLFTDKNYGESENIEIVDVSEEVENYSVTNVDYSLAGSQLKITGTVSSYLNEKAVTVKLYFDDETEAYKSQEVTATAEGNDFEILSDKTNFGHFKVAIDDKDALALDNEVVVYDVESQNISKVLLVSDSPFFMRAALSAAGITNLDPIGTDDYNGDTGYGLYIFDSFMPQTLPDDGAVWFINPQGTLSGTNFSYQTSVEAVENEFKTGYFSTSTQTAVKNLLKGIVDPEDKTRNNSFGIKNYVKCRLNGNFTTLATCENNPILFVGSNAHGNREAVFSFSIQDSAPFLLMSVLPTLVSNLIDYSFPTVIDETNYICGDFVYVNMIAGCSNIKIENPSGKMGYPDPHVAISEYQLNEVGVYNIILVMKDNTERVFNVFAELPEEEREPNATAESFVISGTPGNEKKDELVEILLYIFIVIAVMAVADYGIYCYEQYQLR